MSDAAVATEMKCDSSITHLTLTDDQAAFGNFSIQDMKNLKVLNINSTSGNQFVLVYVKRCPNLEKINFCDTHGGYIGFVFAGLTSLECVDIYRQTPQDGVKIVFSLPMTEKKVDSNDNDRLCLSYVVNRTKI